MTVYCRYTLSYCQTESDLPHKLLKLNPTDFKLISGVRPLKVREFSSIHTLLLMSKQGGKLDPRIEMSQSGVEEVLIFTVTSGNPEQACYGESRAKHSLLI